MTPIDTLCQYELRLMLNEEINTPIQSTVLYGPARETFSHQANADNSSRSRQVGLILMLISFGALMSAVLPFAKLEAGYLASQVKYALSPPPIKKPITPETKPEFDALVTPDSKPIVPVNNDFSIIIPKIGVNATVIPGVNPFNTTGYNDALKKGVAHSSTSFYPSENGTVYLFSHSTNYEWFVKDLNAVFYLIKNIEPGDYVVLMYMGNRYTYTVREKKIVSANAVSYLNPQKGSRNLILESCWPPGTIAQRMLIVADLTEEKVIGKFGNITL